MLRGPAVCYTRVTFFWSVWAPFRPEVRQEGGVRHLVGSDRVPVRHIDLITGQGERSRLDAAASGNQRLDLSFAIGWLEMSCDFRAGSATDRNSLFELSQRELIDRHKAS